MICVTSSSVILLLLDKNYLLQLESPRTALPALPGEFPVAKKKKPQPYRKMEDWESDTWDRINEFEGNSDKSEKQFRSQDRLDLKRHQLGNLYLEGRQLAEISLITGLARDKVIEELSLIRAGWREKYNQEYTERLNDQLAKLDLLEARSWEAWERSTNGTVTTNSKQERVVVNKGTKESPKFVAQMRETEKSTRVVSSAGNPKFLQIVYQCVEMRLRLMGALDGTVTNPATQVQISWESMYLQPGEANNCTTGPHTNSVLNGTANAAINAKLGSPAFDSNVIDVDPIEAKINSIQPVPKPTLEDIPLLPPNSRRGRQDDITSPTKE
jgi:hypothetical protein